MKSQPEMQPEFSFDPKPEEKKPDIRVLPDPQNEEDIFECAQCSLSNGNCPRHPLKKFEKISVVPTPSNDQEDDYLDRVDEELYMSSKTRPKERSLSPEELQRELELMKEEINKQP